MAIITCYNCGKQISNKTKKCIHCGAPVILCDGIEAPFLEESQVAVKTKQPNTPDVRQQDPRQDELIKIVASPKRPVATQSQVCWEENLEGNQVKEKSNQGKVRLLVCIGVCLIGGVIWMFLPGEEIAVEPMNETSVVVKDEPVTQAEPILTVDQQEPQPAVTQQEQPESKPERMQQSKKQEQANVSAYAEPVREEKPQLKEQESTPVPQNNMLSESEVLRMMKTWSGAKQMKSDVENNRVSVDAQTERMIYRIVTICEQKQILESSYAARAQGSSSLRDLFMKL